MRRLVFSFSVVAAAISGAIRSLLRRLFRGPTRPGWTWSEELFVGVSRAAGMASARNLALMSPRGGGPRPPLGRTARDALVVEDVDLGGIRAERYCPKTPP